MIDMSVISERSGGSFAAVYKEKKIYILYVDTWYTYALVSHSEFGSGRFKVSVKDLSEISGLPPRSIQDRYK